MFLGQPIGYWIQTVAIVASAIFAGWQIKALRKQNNNNDIQWRQRATIDAVMADRKDANLIQSRRAYAKMKQDKTNFDAIGGHRYWKTKKPTMLFWIFSTIMNLWPQVFVRELLTKTFTDV